MIDIRSLNASNSKVGLGKSVNSKKKSAEKSSSNSTTETDDSIDLTGQASKIKQLIQQMKSAPVVDPDRISPIQEKLSKGQYSINYQNVANKMLDFESSYSGY